MVSPNNLILTTRTIHLAGPPPEPQIKLNSHMEFYLQVNGQSCKLAKSFGGGDYMTTWEGSSDDGRCAVWANTKHNSLSIGITHADGSVASMGSTFYPEDISEQPSGRKTSIQNL
ncbi:hypothetical protein BGZ96_004535, partial [Linnemannia gamsii]